MFKPRFRLPSPALVVAMLALAVALGGTAFAANSAATKSKHKDQKADIKLIKKLAPTLSVKHAKSANSATTATSATHAATADSATNATTRDERDERDELGGVAASSYLTNSGTIFITTGASNWEALNTTIRSTSSTASTGPRRLPRPREVSTSSRIPSVPTALYGKELELTAATLCYSASTNAKIGLIEVAQNTYSNSGIGDNNIVVVNDKTRTGSGLRCLSLHRTPARAVVARRHLHRSRRQLQERRRPRPRAERRHARADDHGGERLEVRPRRFVLDTSG